jgi:hypothetical protein
MDNADNFTFCEPVFAGPLAPWCIRRLTARGRCVGGGIDTYSLCGRVKPSGRPGGNGWDLPYRFTQERLNRACKACVSELRRIGFGEAGERDG